MGCHLARDARARQLERAGTIARRTKTIDRWEDLPLRIIHLRSVSASMPQSSPARVANQNCRFRSTANSSLGLRPRSLTSTAANSSAFRGPGPSGRYLCAEVIRVSRLRFIRPLFPLRPTLALTFFFRMHWLAAELSHEPRRVILFAEAKHAGTIPFPKQRRDRARRASVRARGKTAVNLLRPNDRYCARLTPKSPSPGFPVPKSIEAIRSSVRREPNPA
jgi:hypothetical protein